MRIEENTIIFKSDDEFYFKEVAGIKPNTVRFIYEPKELKEFIDFYKTIEDEVKYIEVHNSRSPHLFFRRQIRDISYFPERLVWIISWFHEENGMQKGFNAPIKIGRR